MVWEDDWRDKNDIVRKSILDSLCVIQETCLPSSSVSIDVIDTSVACEFFNSCHINGSTSSNGYIGLVGDENNVVSAVAMSIYGDQLHIDRYASSHRVNRGDEMLKDSVVSWAKDHHCSSIVFDSENGSVSNASFLGADLSRESVLDPEFMHVFERKRVSPDCLIGEMFSFELYEKDISKDVLELDRVWDCGKTRFVMEI